MARHGDDVSGVISGFDRLRLQGTLRGLYHRELMELYLFRAGVLWRNFKSHVTAVTGRIRAAAESVVQAVGRPMLYLRSAAERKEDLIAELVRRERLTEGLVAGLSAFEPCRTTASTRTKLAIAAIHLAYLQRGSAMRPKKRHAPVPQCWIAKKNGRSMCTSIGCSGSPGAPVAPTTTAVAAAASVPSSSRAMKVW